MGCWRRMEKISWTDRVRNEEELQTVQDRNILYAIKLQKANFIGHNWRRNCLLEHVIDGKIEGRTEVRGRRERRCKQLVDNLKKRQGYCRLKEEALYRSLRALEEAVDLS
jgi:hypothetical protein